MMGHREPLKGGSEWDYLTRIGRRYSAPKAGKFSVAKRGFNRRARKCARHAARAASAGMC